MLILENVSKTLGEKQIVSDLSLVLEGNLLAISGKNGEGKTTLLKLLAGLLRPDAGRITFAAQASGGRVSYAPSRLSFGLNLPPKFFIETLMRAKGAKFDSATLDRIWKDWRLPSQSRCVNDLSFGNVQKLNLIQALHAQAEIYIFDEPTNGLDAEGKNIFLEKLASVSNSLIILCSHDLEVLSKVSNRIFTLTSKSQKSELIPIEVEPRYEITYLDSGSRHSVIVSAVHLHATLSMLSDERLIVDVRKLPMTLEPL